MMKQLSSRSFYQIVGAAVVAIFLMAPFALAQDEPQAAPADAAVAVQSEAGQTDMADVENAPEIPSSSDQEGTVNGDNPAAENMALDGDTPQVEISQSDITVVPASRAVKLQLGGSIIFVTVIGIFLVSWLLANFFAKAWRMHDYKGRYFIVFFCFLLALFSTVYGLLGHRMNLGM